MASVENFAQFGVNVYKAYDKVKEVKEKAGEIKTYGEGIKGAYDFSKTRDVESFRKVYEAFKEAVSNFPIGKLMMTYYSAGFDLFFLIAQQQQDADKIVKEYNEVLSSVKKFSKECEPLIKSTAEGDKSVISNGPFTYLAKLQRDNPGRKFEDLTPLCQALTKKAVANVRMIDDVLLVLIPLFNNLDLLSNATAADLDKLNSMFSKVKKDDLDFDKSIGDMADISKNISLLLDNRNWWGKWCGGFPSVDPDHYKNG